MAAVRHDGLAAQLQDVAPESPVLHISREPGERRGIDVTYVAPTQVSGARQVFVQRLHDREQAVPVQQRALFHATTIECLEYREAEVSIGQQASRQDPAGCLRTVALIV